MTPKPAPSDPPPRRSRGEETRAAILAAAERHFAERGFEAARLEDIAAEVGIRRAAIFYYFPDKHELYAEMLDEVFGAAQRVLPPVGTAAERILASMSGWIDYVARRPTVARLILREAASAQKGVASPLMRAGSAQVTGPGHVARIELRIGSAGSSTRWAKSSTRAAIKRNPFCRGRRLIASKRSTASRSSGRQPSPNTASVG